MSFIAGNYDLNGNATMMFDSIAIGNDCSGGNLKCAHYHDNDFGDIYIGFSGVASECELMLQHFVRTGIDYNLPKYLLIKEVNTWADNFFSEYNLLFDDCSFIVLVNNRFINFRFFNKDLPYDIYVTDAKDFNKNTIAIGAGLDTYFQFTKLIENTKYMDSISFEEIFNLITTKNIKTSFPTYKIDPSSNECIVYKTMNDSGTTFDLDKFKFIEL